MWDRGHIFTNLNCIQRVMTLVSEKFLTIEKLKVLIFFVVVIYSEYSCEECNYMFSNYASCTGESVCVYGAEYVRVECWLRNIRSDTFIKQLLVRGNCGAASRFKQLCSQDVGFIEMMNSNDTFPCAETSTTINSMESTNDKFSKMAVTTTPVLSPSSVTRGHTPHDISTHGDPTFPITTPVSINNASTSITDSSATLIRTRATSTLTSTVSEGHMISRITPLNVTPTSLISENVSSTTNTDKSFDKGSPRAPKRFNYFNIPVEHFDTDSGAQNHGGP
ncbi:uncharacterized protein LOC128171849 isoform X1 [Crassostrea angulata]|uniref:uncharacterized protein LOC128171849 isoform X1 n=1 Tax=Magallana angulata TaxID=2784310 RepID=UPI0022B20CB1|nr:uncharacterized protein LOC128171849 isoform X1 [Crassostrea angulata]